MTYRAISWERISDPSLQDVFRRANMLLADVYSMLAVKPHRNAGTCNFSIALVLLCVVDGIARDVHPTIRAVPDHETRFKRLIRERLPWGPPAKRWIDIGQAAKWFYCEFRNPLTHELGKDVSEARRGQSEYEPVVCRWDPVPEMRVDSLDALKQWDLRWPVMRWSGYKDGRRISLSGAALYWTVKRMVTNLAATLG
jgi:hypothetical protein